MNIPDLNHYVSSSSRGWQNDTSRKAAAVPLQLSRARPDLQTAPVAWVHVSNGLVQTGEPRGPCGVVASHQRPTLGQVTSF